MARRANGEGSITKRADGRWAARYWYTDPVTGEEKRSYSYGKTRAEAREKMRARQERTTAGQPVADSTMLLGDFVSRWIMTTLRASDRKDSTKATYATLARGYLCGSGIGAVALGKLRASDVEGLLLEMRDLGRAPSTVRQTSTVLRAILDAAVRDGFVARNVAALVKRPGVPRQEAHSMSVGELGDLLREADRSRYGAVLRFLAFTGLRRGEALALRWADVDFEAGTFRVRGTLARLQLGDAPGQLVITEPKTERSRRAVALSTTTRRLLETRRRDQEDDRRRLSDLWDEQCLVFSTADGKAIDPRNVLRALKTAATRAGLGAEVDVHTLRHTAASAMLAAGEPITEVSRMLGHSSIAITGDIYGHVTTEGQRRAADALEAALG